MNLTQSLIKTLRSLFLSIFCHDLHLSGCIWAAWNESLFQSISSLSHCVVSLVNSPGVISTKIRLSIMSNYCQACGPHSVFALALTPALRHATPVPSMVEKTPIQWSESMQREAWLTLPLIVFLVHFLFCDKTLVNFVSSLIHWTVYSYTSLVGLFQIRAT